MEGAPAETLGAFTFLLGLIGIGISLVMMARQRD
jgi:hypothetical protein